MASGGERRGGFLEWSGRDGEGGRSVVVAYS